MSVAILAHDTTVHRNHQIPSKLAGIVCARFFCRKPPKTHKNMKLVRYAMRHLPIVSLNLLAMRAV